MQPYNCALYIARNQWGDSSIWLEPPAHNGVVGGSSPSPPTTHSAYFTTYRHLLRKLRSNGGLALYEWGRDAIGDGKWPRWHQTLKTKILLENYFLPGDLERQIESFVEHYNHERYHESLSNVTPADVYFGRAHSILKRRERITKKTIQHRRLQYRKAVA